MSTWAGILGLLVSALAGVISHNLGQRGPVTQHSLARPAKQQEAEPVTRVLYFSASWCGPCNQWKRTELPRLTAAGWKPDRISELPYEQNRAQFAQYRLRVLPSFVVLRDGKQVATLEGYQTAQRLIQATGGTDGSR